MLLNKHVDLGALPEVAIKYFTQIHSLWLFCIFATWLACTPTCDRGCTVTKPDDFYLFFDLLPYCNIYTHSRRRQEIEKIERSQGRKERGKEGDIQERRTGRESQGGAGRREKRNVGWVLSRKSIRPGREAMCWSDPGKLRSPLNNLQRLLSALMIHEGDLQTHTHWPQPSLAGYFPLTLAKVLTSFTMASPSQPALLACPACMPRLLVVIAGLGPEGIFSTPHTARHQLGHVLNMFSQVFFLERSPCEIWLSSVWWLDQLNSGHPEITGSTCLL